MIEVLLHANLEALLVLLREMMRFIRVREKNDVLAIAPGGIEELQHLYPIHRTVCGAVQDEKWGTDALNVVNWRLAFVQGLGRPRCAFGAHAHLPDFCHALLYSAGLLVWLIIE